MVNRDFRDLFAELNAAGVEYLVVGAHALAVHGHVRATKDLDVWARPSERNAESVLNEPTCGRTLARHSRGSNSATRCVAQPRAIGPHVAQRKNVGPTGSS